MRLKRLGSVFAASVVAFSSILSVFVLPAASAVVNTCTWTGATDLNFSTVTNWSNCGGTAPQAGDNLAFDVTGVVASTTLNNDIVGLNVGTVAVQGTAPSFGLVYKITGNSLTINGGVTDTIYPIVFDVNVTLGADQSFTVADNEVTFGDNAMAHTFDTAGHTLTLNDGAGACGTGFAFYSSLVGSGPLAISGGNSVSLNTDSPNYSGAIAVNSGALFANSSQALGNVSGGTTVSSGAALDFGFTSDTTYAEPLTLAGSGTYFGGLGVGDPVTDPGRCIGGGNPSTTVLTATLSGPIVLTANTTVGTDSIHNVKLTGALSGNFTISVLPGNDGSLIVNASSNTSATPNGSSQAPAVTNTYSDSQPGQAIFVGTNVTAIVDGARGDTSVSKGGTLMGTGTVGILTVDAGGILAPGHSPGCMNSGNFTLVGTYQVQIGGTTACTEYDQMKVTGTVTLNDSGVPPVAGTLDVSRFNGFKPSKGQTFTIIDNDAADAVTGTFANLPEGATFTVDGYVFAISYKGGDGNDVVLTVQNVPATPNTGFGLVAAHPGVTLGLTILLAGSIFGIAQRTRKQTVQSRR